MYVDRKYLRHGRSLKHPKEKVNLTLRSYVLKFYYFGNIRENINLHKRAAV